MENILSARLRRSFLSFQKEWEGIQEIRLRSGQPLVLRLSGEEWFLDAAGNRIKTAQGALRVTAEDIQESMAYICQYSLYAYENEIRQGFITIRGGHRDRGGRADGSGRRKSGKHCLCVFIEYSYCPSDKGLRRTIFFMSVGEWPSLPHPHCIAAGGGKTTLLRDLIRLFSNGFREYPGMSVSLVDERSEVGACYMGVPQNDVGMRTDVMANCPKTEGIQMMTVPWHPGWWPLMSWAARGIWLRFWRLCTAAAGYSRLFTEAAWMM